MREVTTEDIMNYLDGKASDAEKSELEAHLAVCAECSRSKEQIQALERRLRKEPRFGFVSVLILIGSSFRENAAPKNNCF